MPHFFAAWSSRATALILPACLAMAGCTYSHGDEATPAPCETATPALATYSGVIAPIFAANCNRCHGAAVALNLGGGNVYDSHAALSSQDTDLLLGCIKHLPNYDPMPKSGGKISDCDIARIEAWIAAGKPNN